MADISELEGVYRDNYSRVFSYLYHITANGQLAEDITQETFIKAYNSLDSFRHESKISVWLIKIAYNLLIDYKRKGSNQFQISDTDTLEKFTDHSSNLTKEVERKVMTECVQSKIFQLSVNYRVPLFLDMNGYRNQEMADILGCSLATAKIRLHRARKKLKDVLGNDCDVYYDERNELL